MNTPLHYTTKRRIRYLNEIGLAMQVGAIIDELTAIRMQYSYEGAPAFTDLVERVNQIKADIPKQDTA